MKKKIIIVVSVFSLLLLLGGTYLIRKIDTITSSFDELIMFHQVEILREHLLLNIRDVQADLYSQTTDHAESIETIVGHVRAMSNTMNSCFDCHHRDEVTKRLQNLKNDIDRYGHTLSRVLTLKADARRRRLELDNAHQVGNTLIKNVNTMIAMTNEMLTVRTGDTLRLAHKTKRLMIVLIATAPLLIIILAITMIRSLARPIQALLIATRKLKAGDLEYRVEGLRDEFGELGLGFNAMAGSLREQMQKIEESEKRYRLLFESAGDSIFILDTEGERAGMIVAANQAAARLHGYTVEDLLHMNITDLDTPESASAAPSRIKRILNGEWIKVEASHRKKDGTPFPVEISAGMFEFGNHKYILAIDRDITDRKQMEHTLQRAEQIKCAGELATGLAHEIKNPLAGIKVSIEVLTQSLEQHLPAEDKDILIKVIDEIKRIEMLIKGLLNFAKPPQPHFVETDVNAVLDSVASLVLRQESHAPGSSRPITIKKDLDSQLPEITADPMQLKQVFMNLLLNAADAMQDGGTVGIKTRYDALAHSVHIEISDTGRGIDVAVIDRLFQPFFTTKAKGTGLGLPISKRLIEEHGGKISIEQNPEGGATFKIVLPVTQAERVLVT
jgi:two-component system sensor histidine kinase AtoS